MSIGIFQLVKNEKLFIGPWLKHLLPHVDEFVLFDGNSTDGTLDIIDYVKKRYDHKNKIKLFLDKDPPDLKDWYVKYFDDAMNSLHTDWAYFLHPDMHIVNPGKLKYVKESDGIAQFQWMRSFAGDPDDIWYEIMGRGQKWKNIYRLNNPNLGAHYHGWYGAQNEDIYFKSLTGDRHDFHGEMFDKYPYAVEDSGLRVLHFSDVRPYGRRLGRMKTCLRNQGVPEEQVEQMAMNHPRVTFKDDDIFQFIPAQGKAFDEYIKLRQEFEQFQGVKCEV